VTTNSGYSKLQLDGLRELANIGSGTAAKALSTMLDRPVAISIPNTAVLPLADAVEAVGPVDAYVTGVAMPVGGALDAFVLMLFAPEDADALCDLLGVEPRSEMALSALGEIGNILGAKYLGALSSMTGLVLEPRWPPETVRDTLGSIVSTILAVTADVNDTALLLGSDLRVEGVECSFSFLVIPAGGAAGKLLEALGLA
jgi:chemotaxis protein CheC